MPNNQYTHLKLCLTELIRNDNWLMSILKSARALQLPDWCIAGGTIRGLVWDHLHNYTTKTIPSDIDLLFFDGRTQFNENSIRRELERLMPDLDWEPVNQATIHTFTEENPYPSTEFALSRWVETCNAVGVRLEPDDSITVVAPYGLSDLFDLVVRPNIQMPRARQIYEERMASKGWKEKWPRIQILSAE